MKIFVVTVRPTPLQRLLHGRVSKTTKMYSTDLERMQETALSMRNDTGDYVDIHNEEGHLLASYSPMPTSKGWRKYTRG